VYEAKRTAAATFRPRRQMVRAARVIAFCVVDLSTGPATLMPGDYVVTDQAGGELVMRPADFRRWFEPTDVHSASLADAAPLHLSPGELPARQQQHLAPDAAPVCRCPDASCHHNQKPVERLIAPQIPE
jgi:hypothetical protein